MSGYSPGQIFQKKEFDVDVGSDSSYLFIDSEDAKAANAPPTRVIVGQDGNGIMMRKVIRAAISDIQLQWTVPNINPYNNQLVVWVKGKTLTSPVTIDLGESYYPTPEALINLLIAKLQADPLTGGVNVAWQAEVGPANYSYRTMYSLFAEVQPATIPPTYYPFWFDPECSAVRNGAPLWNLPIIPIQATTPVVNDWNKVSCDFACIGPIYCQYTRFIDFHSYRLTEWTKNPSSSSTFGQNQLIYRMHLDPDQHLEAPAKEPPYPTGVPADLKLFDYPAQTYFKKEKPLSLQWFFMKPDEALNVIDFYLTDEFGNDLYNPQRMMEITGYAFTLRKEVPVGTNGGLRWNITLACEI